MISKDKLTRLFDIWTIDSSSIGSPSCFSAIARFNHNFLQVKNLFCNPSRFWALQRPWRWKKKRNSYGRRKQMSHFFAGISAVSTENQSNWNSYRGLGGCAPRERGLICFIFLHIALLDEKEEAKTWKSHFCLSPSPINDIIYIARNKPTVIYYLELLHRVERTWTSYTYLLTTTKQARWERKVIQYIIFIFSDPKNQTKLCISRKRTMDKCIPGTLWL